MAKFCGHLHIVSFYGPQSKRFPLAGDKSLLFDVLATVPRRKAFLFTMFISVIDSDKRHLLRLAALVLDLKALCFLSTHFVVRNPDTLPSEPFSRVPHFALFSVSFENDVLPFL